MSQDTTQLITEAYDLYADAIFRHCCLRTFNREKAKEIMQDTFMKAWEYGTKGNTIDNVRAFLYRIANNLIIDAARKKKEESLDALNEMGFDPPGPDAVRATQASMELQRVLGYVKKLDDKSRDVFLLRYIDGLQPKEIADVLGLSSNAVSVRLHRAVAELKSLANHG